MVIYGFVVRGKGRFAAAMYWRAAVPMRKREGLLMMSIIIFGVNGFDDG